MCAENESKILAVHSRRADKKVLSIIGNNFSGKVIFYWYSGSNVELERGINYRFYYSINSTMVKSNNRNNLLKQILKDRLLIESDGPFIEY
ncbi:TatD family hydrolase [[Flexibacter] sp. ATCC 35208]|uniref:TatD family hydrolase n=1 Tax=[Flexibacter] sp. ATCC 35208 TaxID=1936242 RepID=UPI0034D2F466